MRPRDLKGLFVGTRKVSDVLGLREEDPLSGGYTRMVRVPVVKTSSTCLESRRPTS